MIEYNCTSLCTSLLVGKTNFYFSIVQDQDINLLNLLDISVKR